MVMLGALLWAILPRLIQVATRYQNYPKLLDQVVELRDRVTELEGENVRLRATADAAVKVGIDEGMRRAYGTLAASISPALELKSIAEIDGSLVLVADYPEDDQSSRVPRPLARFAVVDSNTEIRKGVVEVVRVEEDRRLVFLECVEATVGPFWERLQERAAGDATAPAHSRLDPVTYDLPGPRTGMQPVVRPELEASE